MIDSYFGKETIVVDLRKHGNATFARGAFGELSLAIVAVHPDDDNNDDDPPVWRIAAIKTIPQQTLETTTTLLEIETLRLLRENPHQNIVRWLAFYPDTLDPFLAGIHTPLALAFEYCPTDLHASLQWRKRNLLPLLSFAILKTIAKDLFAALSHCHSNKILHADVKPGNLLVSSNGVIQLCDFGLAKRIQTNKTTTSTQQQQQPLHGLCTLHYRPPEILLGDYSIRHASIDMFSAGLVMAELLTGRTLFPGINELDQISILFDALGTPTETHWPAAQQLPHCQQLHFGTKKPRPIREIIPRALESQGLEHLLQQLLQLDPDLRCTSEQAAQHPWIQQNHNNGGSASRITIQQELIPQPWIEPIVLAVDENHLQCTATKHLLDMAAKRRSLWKDTEVWTEKG